MSTASPILAKVREDLRFLNQQIEDVEAQIEDLQSVRNTLIAERERVEYVQDYITANLPVEESESLYHGNGNAAHNGSAVREPAFGIPIDDYPEDESIAAKAKFVLYHAHQNGIERLTKGSIFSILEEIDPEIKRSSFESQFSRALGEGISKDRLGDGSFVYYLTEDEIKRKRESDIRLPRNTT